MARRIAEAFREGIASAKADYVKRPEVKIPPAEKTKRQESADARILDRAIQEGGSAAAAVADKAAIALDRVVQLAKMAPAVTHKFAQAFREGAASVKPREGRERTERLPQSAEQHRSASKGKGMLDSALHPGVSAREILRGAVTAVKPSAVRGARRKIRMCKKRIDNLHIEIGCEAVNAWGSGPVETEKVARSVDEVRKNEEEIEKLLDHIAEIEAARKTDAARSQPAAKEVAFSPAVSPAPERMEEAEVPPREEVIVGTDLAMSDAPAQQPMPDAEAAPPEELSLGTDQAPIEQPAPVHMEEAEAAPRQEISAGADQAPSEKPAAIPEKREDTDLL